MAVDDTGDVIATTNPIGGTRGWKVLLRLPPQETRGGPVPEALTYVTCPSTHECIAGDPSTPYLEGSEPGMLLVSRDPARPGSWHGQRTGLSTVTCPSAHLCLAGSAGAQLAYTRHPTGGTKTWKYLRVADFNHGATGDPESVTCASVRLCVAGGGGRGGGEVAESSAPTVARSWQVTQLTGSPIAGVRCFRRPVCIAYSQVGELFVGR